MSRRSSALALVATAAVSALALTGCAGAAPSSSGERVDGGTIVYAHQQEPACVFGGWIEQAYLSYQVLDNLVSLDEDHQVVPWLAESWEESEDGLSWTFTLKDGVEFTDGTPVDAEAIAYNFDYWVAGGNSTAYVWLLDYYESANAVDDLTRAHRPVAALPPPGRQPHAGLLRHPVADTRSRRAPTRRTAPRRSARAPSSSTTGTAARRSCSTRNDDYTSWPANAEHTGPAYVEQIDWKFVPDATTRVAALQSGEVSAIYDVPAVQWQTLDDGGYQLEKYVTPGRPQQLSFNTQVGPFTDEQVRQAFAYSLDRELIVDTIGHGVIPFEGNGGVSQTTPGYSQKAADAYSLDLDKANDAARRGRLERGGRRGLPHEGRRAPDGRAPVRRRIDHQRRRRRDPPGGQGAGDRDRLRRRAHPGAAERAVLRRVLDSPRSTTSRSATGPR